MSKARALINEQLRSKSAVKSKVAKITEEKFQLVKKCVAEVTKELRCEISDLKEIQVNYESKSGFEVDLEIGSDILAFTLHSNTFTFDAEHFIHNTDYVKEDKDRAFCGVIQIYNFLTDSIKYHRHNDLGYLIGRIFINKEGHFFVEGKKQLAFLYNEFKDQVLTKEQVMNIIESSILYSLSFDLLTPPYEEVQVISLKDKLQQSGIMAQRTGKRVGFKFNSDSDSIS